MVRVEARARARVRGGKDGRVDGSSAWQVQVKKREVREAWSLRKWWA